VVLAGRSAQVFTHATHDGEGRKSLPNETRTIVSRIGNREVGVARGRRNGTPEPEYVTMGDRLRQARQARGMSLRRLAEVLGVSPSLISQVETGRAKPSVHTLYAMANELNISLDVLLFMDTPTAAATPTRVFTGSPFEHVEGQGLGEPAEPVLPRDPVQRASSRMTIRLGSGVVWERLTTESIRNVDFLLVTYEVGGASSPEDAFQRHSGQEWGYVLSGTLRVTIGFDEFVLGPGDAITFDSGTPHRLANAGDQPVRAVWYVLGRTVAEFAQKRAGAEAPATARG
jgi:transcriptional regulator with XRE-family HTH domain/quercetin dioxygenase-like cupin family protein